MMIKKRLMTIILEKKEDKKLSCLGRTPEHTRQTKYHT